MPMCASPLAAPPPSARAQGNLGDDIALLDSEPGVVASIVRSWPADWPLAEAEARPSPVPLLAHA
jgi:hypothetical protein